MSAAAAIFDAHDITYDTMNFSDAGNSAPFRKRTGELIQMYEEKKSIQPSLV